MKPRKTIRTGLGCRMKKVIAFTLALSLAMSGGWSNTVHAEKASGQQAVEQKVTEQDTRTDTSLMGEVQAEEEMAAGEKEVSGSSEEAFDENGEEEGTPVTPRAEDLEIMPMAGGIAPTLDGDYAYVSDLKVDMITDGTAPFDTDSDPSSLLYKDRDGNDENDSNGRVRTFDTITYDLSYQTKVHGDYDYVENGWLNFEFALPYSVGQAEFSVDSMQWMGSRVSSLSSIAEGNSGYTLTTDSNGYQVITGKRWLQGTDSNPYPIGGYGTLSVKVKVLAMANGDTVVPTFTAWMEHNTVGEVCGEHWIEEYKSVTPDAVEVTAMLKLNVQMAQGNNVNGSGTYDFSTGNNRRLDQSAGQVQGRASGYGITLQLYNDVANKGFKGIEVPAGDITFDIKLSSAFRPNGGAEVPVSSTYSPLVWTAGAFTANTNGQDGRVKTVNGNRSYPGAVAPENNANHTVVTKTDSNCYDGGTWNFTKNGNVVSVTVSNYQIDTSWFPSDNYGSATDVYYDPSSSLISIGCFSAGELYLVQPFYNNTTSEYVLDDLGVETGDFHVTVEDCNLQATGISGAPLPVVADNSNQTPTNPNDDKITYQCGLKKPGSYQARSFYTSDSSTVSYKDLYGRTGADSSGSYIQNGQDWAVNGFEMGIGFGMNQQHEGEMDNRHVAANMLMKFDSAALELTGGMGAYDYMRNPHSYGYELTILYATKADGTAWIDDNEMQGAKMEQLKYFSTLAGAEAYGEVIGVLAEVRPLGEVDDVALVSQTHCLLSAMCRVKQDVSLWGNVYMTCVGNKVWRVSEYEAAGSVPSLLDNDPVNPTVLPQATITDYPTYTKSNYDDSGYAGGHTGTYIRGDSLYIVGYQAKITKEVAQKESGSVKQIYDLDYNQRVADYQLNPKVTLANGEASDLRTTVTITDTLGTGLSYRTGSAYYGGTYIQNDRSGYAGTVTGGTQMEPQITVNGDRTTTLVWVIPNVQVGVQMLPVYYSADIGTPGDEENDVEPNATLTNTVQIQATDDKREISIFSGNKAEVGIRVSKLKALSHSKIADQVMNEVGDAIGYTLNVGNNGDNPIIDAVLLDILPYNGDPGGSRFDGPLSVQNWAINTTVASNWSTWKVFYTTDPAVKGTTAADHSANDIRNGTSAISWSSVSMNMDGTIPGLNGRQPTAVVVIGTILAGETCKLHMEMIAPEAQPSSKFANSLYYGDSEVTSTTYYVSRALLGIVWLDADNDGRQEDGEKKLSGITVTLLKEAPDSPGTYSVVLDTNGDPVTAVTDENGAYTFQILEAGTYGVRFGSGTELNSYTASETKADGVHEYFNSDGVPSYGPGGVLEYTEITGIVMPPANELNTSLYESRFNDTGLYRDFNATFTFESGTPGKDLPQAIMDMIPEDQTGLMDGAEVNTETLSETTVADETNDGTWIFDGWDKESDTIDGEDIDFTGTWIFTPNEYKATHEFQSGTEGMELPEAILNYLPEDLTGLLNGENAEAGTPDEVTYIDEINDGTWAFVSWDEDEKSVNKDDVEFVGTWLFTPNQYKATHEFHSGSEGVELPEAILNYLPEDIDHLLNGQTAEAGTPSQLTYTDFVNDGTWVFIGWDDNSRTIDHADAEFLGTWVFMPNEYQATHEFESGTPGRELPEAIQDYLPGDVSGLLNGDNVTAGTPDELTYEDAVNDGTWTFISWDEDEKNINKENVEFVGTWEFTPNEHMATHEFQSGTDGMELPEAIRDYLPGDVNGLLNGDNVTAGTPDELTYEDTVNDGTWTFVSWDADEKTVNKDDVEFLGTWIFTPNEYQASFEFESSTPGKDLPQEIKEMKPGDKTGLTDGTEVNAEPPSNSTVIDEANDGIWTFDGWDKDRDTIDREDVDFTGTWTFTPNEYQGIHVFESGTDGMELPEAIQDYLPGEVNGLLNGDNVTAGTPDELTYEDAVNDGTWIFVSWDADEKTVNKDDVEFVGTWVFTPNEYKATHEFQSGTEGMDLPDDILNYLPDDIDNLQNGDTAEAGIPDKLTYDDEANDGTWKFEGWDKESETIDHGDTTFSGTWVFTPNEYQAVYDFESGTPGRPLPQEVINLIPDSRGGYVNGDTADAPAPSQTEVKVPEGTWTFVEWDADNKEIDRSDADFLGTWVFTPNPGVPEKMVAKDSPAGGEGGAVKSGDQIKYVITYKNDTNDTADITITDMLDQGVDFITASDNGVYDAGSHSVTWVIADAVSLEEGEVSLTVAVNNDAIERVINQAVVQVGNEPGKTTNQLENPLETTSLRVTKIWEDNDNAAGVRPQSITVDLYRDGEVINQVILSDENSWTAFFEELPVGTTTATYSYEVREQAVKNYTAKYSKVSTEWTIVNTYTKGIADPGQAPGGGAGSSVFSKYMPKTGDTANLALWCILLAIAAGAIILAVDKRYKKV